MDNNNDKKESFVTNEDDFCERHKMTKKAFNADVKPFLNHKIIGKKAYFTDIDEYNFFYTQEGSG